MKDLIFHYQQAFTIYIRRQEDGSILFSNSVCHPNDQFSRKRGVTIARGRMEAGKFEVVTDKEDLENRVHTLIVNLNKVRRDDPYVQMMPIPSFVDHVFHVTERLR